jgi:L-ascorbate metabolism protein UlaG (beta-lactamase superfamily)
MLRFFKYFVVTILVVSFGIFLFMQRPSFGKNPSGKRLARVEASAHYRDGKFRNMVPTQTIAEGVSYFAMATEFFRKDNTREPSSPLKTVATDLNKLDGTLPTIVWFGHSSYLLQLKNLRFLVDPVFSERASPVNFVGSKRFPGTNAYSAEQMPPLDAIIITHDHYDHLDYNSVVALNERTKLFFVPLGVGEHLVHWGIPEKKVVELDWWESSEVIGGVELIATPSRHFSGRGLRRDKTLWASYVLKTAGYRFFIGGDSGYDSTFKVIGERFGPFHIAMLECGQYDEKWPSIHMMPEETVRASKDLGAKVLLPVHWAKFALGLHPWTEPVNRAAKEAERLGVDMTTPRIGEPVLLGATLPRERWWD